MDLKVSPIVKNNNNKTVVLELILLQNAQCYFCGIGRNIDRDEISDFLKQIRFLESMTHDRPVIPRLFNLKKVGSS